MNEIKYIGFYGVSNIENKRTFSLAAANKMDYICQALNKAGFNVHLVSPSGIGNTETSVPFQKTTTVELEEKKKLTSVFTFSTTSKFTRNIKIISSFIWLFFWLIYHVKRKEKILVYHSPWLVLSVLLAKKIKRFELILEVEEVYSDVSSLHPYFDKLEQKIFNSADYFLFSTELLAKTISSNKEGIIIYGNYSVFETLATPIADGKIHLVYAGIIDSHKAGAFNAIESAVYLPENYVMHIIGFGEVDKLIKRIVQINNTSNCKVYYDGIKSDNQYIEFCQSCHIGLSTQKMEGTYLNTSFPSKILSYLGMGLKVVSCYVSCVSESRIGDLVSYYQIDEPKNIAEAIMKVEINEVNTSIEIIRKLDVELVQSIKGLLES
jgi:hypothetical protein